MKKLVALAVLCAMSWIQGNASSTAGRNSPRTMADSGQDQKFAQDVQGLGGIVSSSSGNLSNAQGAQAVLLVRDMEGLVPSISSGSMIDNAADLFISLNAITAPKFAADESKILIGLLEGRPYEFMVSLSPKVPPTAESVAVRLSKLKEIVKLIRASDANDMDSVQSRLSALFSYEAGDGSHKCKVDDPLIAIMAITPSSPDPDYDPASVDEDVLDAELAEPAACYSNYAQADDNWRGHIRSVTIKGVDRKRKALAALDTAIKELNDTVASKGITTVFLNNPFGPTNPTPNRGYFSRVYGLTYMLIAPDDNWTEVATFNQQDRDELNSALLARLGEEFDVLRSAPSVMTQVCDGGHCYQTPVIDSEADFLLRSLFHFALKTGALTKPLVPHMNPFSNWREGIDGVFFAQIIARVLSS